MRALIERYSDAWWRREEDRRSVCVADYIWFLAIVPWQKEDITLDLIERRGLTGYRPLRKGWTRKTRYQKRAQACWKPLIPRYVVVGAKEIMDITALVDLPYSVRLDTTGGKARVMEHDDVNWALSIDVEAPEVQRDMTPGSEFEVGDDVRFVRGPFKYFIGSVKKLTGNPDRGPLRAMVETDVFGRLTPIEAWPGDLEPV